MSAENHRIEKYQYEYRTDEVDGLMRCIGLLYLYGHDHVLLAALAFMPDGTELQRPEQSPNGHVSAQLPMARMESFVDMLRNERPVYFSWSPDGGVLRLSTRDEPVGEQELRRLFSFLYI